METIASLVMILASISMLVSLVALFFLQSRAKGAARVLIIAGATLSVAIPLLMGFVKERGLLHGIIAVGGSNIGIMLLSIGVILFAISLPSKRLQLKADDRKPISSQIIEESLEHGDDVTRL